jgi:hypothetical protein
MTKKVTIPLFDMSSFSEKSQILNSIEQSKKNSIQHFEIDDSMTPHDQLFIKDVIEYEVVKPNESDIFLIRIGKHIYLRKIAKDKNLIRFEPVTNNVANNTVIIDKNMRDVEIIGKFRKKILVL